ncbi:MAG: hypothetical protein HY852_22530 [Bradyrhizobium sp.]|uniref:hypothetical protein n=1 Tax=Bradyrhizobium sp. TaxID=376 RepID=UPI0025C2D082|nr:hypothetical protein [Bradyrhizobium sp.]MBI5264580.1 hypothetical protein [Bradyrhizobium sp.]
MSKRLIATLVCSALSLVAVSGIACSEPVGRYDCNVIGTALPEPIGDRTGHGLISLQYSCIGVEGLLKGAVVTAVTVSEWDGPKGTYLSSVGVHRVPGGLAVGQLTEGIGSVVMKDGKPVGTEASGKTIFKFASGALAALSGKTVKFASKSTGSNRFELEFTQE